LRKSCFPEEVADLLAPLGEEAADKFAGWSRKEKRILLQSQMEEEGIDARDGIKA
jgi:hypothetical protein